MTEPLATVHLVLAALAGTAVVGGMIVGAAGWFMDRVVDRWLDRAILLLLAASAGTALVGLLLLATGHQPSDLLHLLYAAAIAVTVPLVRVWAASRPPRRRAALLALAFLVSAAYLARLVMTS